MELYSKFNIRWGYNNICIREEDQWKATCWNAAGELLMPKNMTQGLYSPWHVLNFMNHILEPWYQKYGRKKGKNYMDDIGIATLTSEIDLHMNMVDNLFDILAAHGLHLKLSKSVFMQPQMDFLGMRINKDGITIDPAKIAGIIDWPEAIHNLKGVRTILGIC